MANDKKSVVVFSSQGEMSVVPCSENAAAEVFLRGYRAGGGLKVTGQRGGGQYSSNPFLCLHTEQWNGNRLSEPRKVIDIIVCRSVAPFCRTSYLSYSLNHSVVF